MNIKKTLAPLAFAALIFSSCTKDPVETTTTNTVSTTAATNKCDYSPYSVGSSFTTEFAIKNPLNNKWTYSEYKGSITGLQTINNVKWSVGKGFFAADTLKSSTTKDEFVRCDDKGLFLLQKGVNNGKDLEFQMLQFPLTKGKTWKSTEISQIQQGVSVKQYFEYKVINIGLTRTVKKNTFKDVAEIEESAITSVSYNGETTVSKSTYTRFFSKSVGHIQTIFYYEDPFSGEKDTSIIHNLVSYNIK